MIPNNKLLLDVCNIAIEAGKKILNFYSDDIEVTHKEDLSPLTKADLASNKIILESLTKLNSNIPILSEESLVDWSIRKNWKKYWLVDPLDGTKEFIKKNGEFTVNIALIEDNNPILGVVYVPAKSLLYLAEKNKGSFKTNTKDKLEKFEGIQKILVSSQKNRARVIGSRSHSNATFDNWVKEKFPNADIVQAGSSLKFCMIAEGLADFYPRLAPTSEWDTAAAQAILEGAGGSVNDMENKRLSYQKKSILNPFFIARGK